VVVILLLTYRSPTLWLLPLTCVFVALTAAQAVIYLLARDAGLTVNGQSAFILTVLVFGAAHRPSRSIRTPRTILRRQTRRSAGRV
jgi:uncharacterized membrane protein YdfJ with MMPL/SSD domain